MDLLWYRLLGVALAIGVVALLWWLSRQEAVYDAITKIGSWRWLPSLKNPRRARLMKSHFPEQWLEYLRQNVRMYHHLTAEEQKKLRELIQVFLAEREWEGCGGLELDDEIKVTIAAHACILLLGIEHDYFSQVSSILVYPAAFQIPAEAHGQSGNVIEGDTPVLGEAWYRGPVILAWDDVLAGGRGEQPGHNVVFHEFAHQLDFLGSWENNDPSGKPLRKRWRRWQQVMTEEYHRLVRAAKHGKPTLLDKYGASNPAEFFAVATECFFEQPQLMQEFQPRLYDVMRDFYGQDPAARLERSA